MNGRIARSVLISLTAIATVSACSSLNDMLQGDRVDYKSLASAKTPTLEVPPDLNSLPKDDRYTVPERASTSLTTYNAQRTNAAASDSSVSGMLPVIKDAHIERAGGQRWLVVDKAPEEIWSTVHEFWQDSGFLINRESQQTGIMETDWAENRAKIPQDIIRRTIGKVFDGLYSTGELDKFRTRIERTSTGGSEIYISHRGMVETYTSTQKDQTAWQPRPADPELEAEFLRRLLVRFGTEPERAKAIVASNTAASNTPAAIEHSKLIKAAGATAYVEVDDSFDRAWRRIGLALDRVGFTVEDRDRNQGVYFVRYVDPNAEINQKPGFFSRLFGSEDRLKQAAQYRVTVQAGVEKTGNASRITVQNKDGTPETSPVGLNILELLNEQLK